MTIDTSATVAAVLQGVYCGEQPYRVLAVCLLVIGVCCLGLLRFKVETNPQRLWVGAGSLAAKEKAQYEVTNRLMYNVAALQTCLLLLLLRQASLQDQFTLPAAPAAAAVSVIAGSTDATGW